jgi:arginyl-tRNA synthetase
MRTRVSQALSKKTKKLETKKNSDGPQPSELALIKLLLQYPEMIREVTNSYEVQKVPFYALELARTFHDFYTKCRVIDNDEVIASRLVLVHATKKVLAETLGLMGISTPESM